MLRSFEKKSSQVTADEKKIDVALFLPKSKPSFSPVQKNKVIDSIPAEHLSLSGLDQKRSFINIVLPLILIANAEVNARREAINRAYLQHDRLSLDRWAGLYKIKSEGLDDQAVLKVLLKRADEVPFNGWRRQQYICLGNIEICE